MKKNLPIRFYESGSWLNRLNPVVKLIWLIFLSLLLLWFNDYRIELVLLVITVLLVFLSRVNLLRLQGSKFVISTSILIGLIQLAFNHQGFLLTRIGPMLITSAGMENALLISARFLSIVLLGYLFVISTEPNALVYSLMQIGLPYRFGFSLITALRLIPVFSNEASNIFQAQITRGVVYRFYPPRRYFTNVFQFLKVLLVSMISKVDGLVISMEGRSFGANPTRTYTRMVGYSLFDKALLVIGFLLFIIIIVLGKVGIL